MQELRNTESRAEDAANEKDGTGREPTGSMRPRDEVTTEEYTGGREERARRSRDEKREGRLLEEKAGTWVRVSPIPEGRDHPSKRSRSEQTRTETSWVETS